MSRYFLSTVGLIATLAASSVAHAAQATLSWGETIRPNDAPWEQNNVGKYYGGSSNYSFTGNPNVHGYANASNGKLGVFAASQRVNYSAGGAYPGGYQYTNYGTEVQSASIATSYADHVTVQGANAGQAVTISVKLRLDGKLVNGPLKHDPQTTSSNANMQASFQIVDQSIADGEAITPLVSFSASASALRNTTRNGETPYYYADRSSGWNVAVRTDANNMYFDGDSSNYHNENPLSYWDIGAGNVPDGYVDYGDVLNFDTGLLTLTFETYVGAELDISSYLSVDAFSDSQTGLTMADFSNTLGASWEIINGDASLKFSSADLGTEVITTPEPATLAIFAATAGGLLLRKRRSH